MFVRLGCSEQAIACARASVMVYEDSLKKWLPAGTSGQQGISKVQIYQHQEQQTFRVVGRKVADHEVVLNCAVGRGLKYNQATPTFHQWRDQRQVYGLNFAAADDAAQFAAIMLTAIEVATSTAPAAPAPAPAQAHTHTGQLANEGQCSLLIH